MSRDRNPDLGTVPPVEEDDLRRATVAVLRSAEEAGWPTADTIAVLEMLGLDASPLVSEALRAHRPESPAS